MATGLAHQTASPRRSSTSPRRLIVVWQHPSTRQFHQVGRLDLEADGQYAFEYLEAARSVPGFDGFAAFPDLRHRYRSDRLFPFFTNRVLSPRRPEYAEYIVALGLRGGDASPVEILARSGGTRATDTVHVVPEPQVDEQGRHVLLFLASGVRHVQDADELICQLDRGDELEIRAEPDNAVNANALILCTPSGRRVGWVPDYLLALVHDLRDRGHVRVSVERANGPDVPAHVRLLCRLEALPSPSA